MNTPTHASSLVFLQVLQYGELNPYMRPTSAAEPWVLLSPGQYTGLIRGAAAVWQHYVQQKLTGQQPHPVMDLVPWAPLSGGPPVDHGSTMGHEPPVAILQGPVGDSSHAAVDAQQAAPRNSLLSMQQCPTAAGFERGMHSQPGEPQWQQHEGQQQQHSGKQPDTATQPHGSSAGLSAGLPATWSGRGPDNYATGPFVRSGTATLGLNELPHCCVPAEGRQASAATWQSAGMQGQEQALLQQQEEQWAPQQPRLSVEFEGDLEDDFGFFEDPFAAPEIHTQMLPEPPVPFEAQGTAGQGWQQHPSTADLDGADAFAPFNSLYPAARPGMGASHTPAADYGSSISSRGAGQQDHGRGTSYAAMFSIDSRQGQQSFQRGSRSPAGRGRGLQPPWLDERPQAVHSGSAAPGAEHFGRTQRHRQRSRSPPSAGYYQDASGVWHRTAQAGEGRSRGHSERGRSSSQSDTRRRDRSKSPQQDTNRRAGLSGRDQDYAYARSVGSKVANTRPRSNSPTRRLRAYDVPQSSSCGPAADRLRHRQNSTVSRTDRGRKLDERSRSPRSSRNPGSSRRRHRSVSTERRDSSPTRRRSSNASHRSPSARGDECELPRSTAMRNPILRRTDADGLERQAQAWLQGLALLLQPVHQRLGDQHSITLFALKDTLPLPAFIVHHFGTVSRFVDARPELIWSDKMRVRKNARSIQLVPHHHADLLAAAQEAAAVSNKQQAMPEPDPWHNSRRAGFADPAWEQHRAHLNPAAAAAAADCDKVMSDHQQAMQAAAAGAMGLQDEQYGQFSSPKADVPAQAGRIDANMSENRDCDLGRCQPRAREGQTDQGTDRLQRRDQAPKHQQNRPASRWDTPANSADGGDSGDVILGHAQQQHSPAGGSSSRHTGGQEHPAVALALLQHSPSPSAGKPDAPPPPPPPVVPEPPPAPGCSPSLGGPSAQAASPAVSAGQALPHDVLQQLLAYSAEDGSAVSEDADALAGPAAAGDGQVELHSHQAAARDEGEAATWPPGVSDYHTSDSADDQVHAAATAVADGITQKGSSQHHGGSLVGQPGSSSHARQPGSSSHVRQPGSSSYVRQPGSSSHVRQPGSSRGNDLVGHEPAADEGHKGRGREPPDGSTYNVEPQRRSRDRAQYDAVTPDCDSQRPEGRHRRDDSQWGEGRQGHTDSISKEGKRGTDDSQSTEGTLRSKDSKRGEGRRERKDSKRRERAREGKKSKKSSSKSKRSSKRDRSRSGGRERHSSRLERRSDSEGHCRSPHSSRTPEADVQDSAGAQGHREASLGPAGSDHQLADSSKPLHTPPPEPNARDAPATGSHCQAGPGQSTGGCEGEAERAQGAAEVYPPQPAAVPPPAPPALPPPAPLFLAAHPPQMPRQMPPQGPPQGPAMMPPPGGMSVYQNALRVFASNLQCAIRALPPYAASTGRIPLTAAAEALPRELAGLVYSTAGLTVQRIINDHLLGFAVQAVEGLLWVQQLPVPRLRPPVCAYWRPEGRDGCRRSALCSFRHDLPAELMRL